MVVVRESAHGLRLTHYQGLSTVAHYKTIGDCFPEKQQLRHRLITFVDSPGFG
ncbi:MAG: hypothetical protein NTX52_02815 [Planctomycetota bacterium]|nr:hypothetical protein [Planctomycetota bacterium]